MTTQARIADTPRECLAYDEVTVPDTLGFLSRVEGLIREAEGILGRNGCGIGGGYWSRRYVRLLDIRGYLNERLRRGRKPTQWQLFRAGVPLG